MCDMYFWNGHFVEFICVEIRNALSLFLNVSKILFIELNYFFLLYKKERKSYLLHKSKTYIFYK